MEHFTFTKPGREWNEDRVYSCDDFAFVLDGATCLFNDHYSKYATDAEWYSNWWCEYLKKSLGNTKKEIPDILKAGIKKVVKDYQKLAKDNVIEDFPSSTVSIVRRNNGMLEFYSLTDSSMVVLSKSGICITIQEQGNTVKDAFTIMKVLDTGKKHNMPLMEARHKFGEIVQQARIRKNQFALGGYYVLADSEEAINHGIYASVEEALIDKVLILSDGYSQVYDVVKFMPPEKLIKKINSYADAEKIYNKLVKYQQKDKLAKKYYRFKVSDDTSLAYLKF